MREKLTANLPANLPANTAVYIGEVFIGNIALTLVVLLVLLLVLLLLLGAYYLVPTQRYN